MRHLSILLITFVVIYKNISVSHISQLTFVWACWTLQEDIPKQGHTSQNKDTLLSMMKWVSDRLHFIAILYTSFSSVQHSTCIQDHSTRHGLVNPPASMVPRQCIDCTTSYTQCYAQLLFLLCYNKIINLSASIHMCTRITCSHHNHARIQIYTKHYVQACYYVGNLILFTSCTQKQAR